MSATAPPTAPPPKPDFFISYTHEDREWAEWIAWQIEDAHFTTVLQAWDFHPGGNFVLQMQQELSAASRMIAVLSPAYLESVYTAPEWASFFALDPTGRDQKLVPVKVRPCQPTGLLSQIIYIDLVNLDREVAKNTLLNGVRPGRAKPASSPEFPGRGAPEASLPAPAVEAAPRRPVASFPGPSTAPPESGSSPFSLEYSVDIPDEIAGAEAAFILLSFTLLGGGNQITLEFEQDAFEIYYGSRTDAGEDRNRFQFDYPDSGKFHEKLKICAKDKTGNNRVSVTCTDASGKRWGQNTKNVRVSKAPSIWESTRFILVLLLRPIRRRPITSAAVALALLAGWAVEWYMNTSPAAKRDLAVRMDPFRPKDYFADHPAWNDMFWKEDFTDASWGHSPGTKWHDDVEPLGLGLVIEEDGFAVTTKALDQTSFYDFTADFQITLLSPDESASWAFDVWPQGKTTNIRQSRGYRFTLSLRSGGIVQITGERCKHLGDVSCERLTASGVENMILLPCPNNPTFQIHASARGADFKFEVTPVPPIPPNLSKPTSEGTCSSALAGHVSYHDDSLPLLPFSPYGAIAFLNAQVVKYINVKPNTTAP